MISDLLVKNSQGTGHLWSTIERNCTNTISETGSLRRQMSINACMIFICTTTYYKSSKDNFQMVFLFKDPIHRTIFHIVYSRYFFELMSHFSKDELEKEKLEEFSSPEGQVTSQTDGAC